MRCQLFALVLATIAVPTTVVVVAGAEAMGAVQGQPPVAASPTFYRDVLPILQRQCQSCHRPANPGDNGLVAPMSLMTYSEVRPWAASIVRRVQAHEMPPWRASDKMNGLFDSERRLSDAEISTIERWASDGALGGRPEDAPPPPVVTPRVNGWVLGEPDVTIVAAPTVIPDENTDDLTQHEVGEAPSDIWVQGVEFRAGSPAVHHMCATALLPPSTPGSEREISLGCAAPGVDPRMLPDGYAFLLPKGAIIRFEVHGKKRTGPNTAVRYQSVIGLTVTKTPVRHRVRFNPVSNSTFEIPPGNGNWSVGAVRVFERETTILALWPHGHVRAVGARYTATYPDGTSELLLDVPRFDQEWQEVYRYREPKRVPAGTRLEAAYRYDNSLARGAKRGFDASQPVRFGPRAMDEMMIAFVQYTDESPVEGSSDGRAPVAAPVRLPQYDAVDRDLWWRGDSALPGAPNRVVVAFPRFGTDESVVPIDALRPGDVLSNRVSAVMKLRTEVPLDFGATRITPGNVATGFAGLYGLWIKKAADGWRLVFTNEPDVLGSHLEASSVVAEVPLRYEGVPGGTGRFAAVLQDRPGGGELVLTWGTHRWTSDFGLPQPK